TNSSRTIPFSGPKLTSKFMAPDSLFRSELQVFLAQSHCVPRRAGRIEHWVQELYTGRIPHFLHDSANRATGGGQPVQAPGLDGLCGQTLSCVFQCVQVPESSSELEIPPGTLSVPDAFLALGMIGIIMVLVHCKNHIRCVDDCG